jgi:septal ring factor EnvC (AmiA/AmiB activator)
MTMADKIKRQTAAVVAINRPGPDPLVLARNQIANLQEQVRHEQAECERLEQELAAEQQRTRTAQEGRVHDAERAARAEALLEAERATCADLRKRLAKEEQDCDDATKRADTLAQQLATREPQVQLPPPPKGWRLDIQKDGAGNTRSMKLVPEE